MKLLLLIGWFMLFSGEPGKNTEATGKQVNILFVGNSLTYYNQLPEMIKELSLQDSVTVTYTAHCYPDYALDDHWKDGKIQKEIKSGKYQFVVAQQGPSALPESQQMLLDAVKKLSRLCKKNNTRLALYMVWPARQHLFNLDKVIESYTRAATETGSLICAAGTAWKNAWAEQPETALYGNDGFHPSPQGSLLAALTIYGTLLEKKELNFFTRNITGVTLSAEEMNRFKRLAGAVLAAKQ
ncbi:MAG: hypothetical protein JNM68_02410 [Dinghuibacter sp.]|nr:hypothetical protein [Dinghuibacter sp.]